MKPVLIDEFKYNGQTIAVEWFEVDKKSDLPDEKWHQVYAIANTDGKVPVVYYQNKSYNLPGGKTEAGETIDQTLSREIAEELNCKVISWQPIGYQKLTDENGKIAFQLRVYAKIEKIGEFIKDPAGDAIGYELVELKDLNKTIKHGLPGDRMTEICIKYFL